MKVYQQKRIPFSWWVSEIEDNPKNLHQILEESGLKLREEETGMYLELEDFHPHASKEIIRRVDAKTLSDFTEIISTFAGHDEVHEHLYKNLPSILYEEGSPLEMYVLYRNGIPVSTGMALFHANVVGIYYVATRPEYRKIGLGTEMMHQLVARAKARGYNVVTLQASPQGKNLYRRLGFNECCWIREYVCL
jgi:ribosomal protein S18 acetylase RimI-like enzyme